MARKLGETLVAKGLVTRQQVDQALRIQVMRGGHLGTCLIELGFTDERANSQVSPSPFEIRDGSAFVRSSARKML